MGLISERLFSVSELERALNELPDQTDGDSHHPAISQAGEPYVSFLACGVARPGDEKIVERYVVQDMARRLNQYFDDKSGRIYWRERFTYEIRDHSVILRLDANGPDRDVITGEACVMDKNWRIWKMYSRVFRAKHSTVRLIPAQKVG